MADSDFGPRKQEIAKRLIGALVDHANEDLPHILKLKSQWKDSKDSKGGREELIVEAETLHPLKQLIKTYESTNNVPDTDRLTDKLLSKELGAVLHRLKDMTGILTMKSSSDTSSDDASSIKRGQRKEGWSFTLTLPSLRREECMEEFENWCRERQEVLDSRRKKQSSGNQLQIQTALAPVDASRQTPPHNIRFSGVGRFVGREAELCRLKELLEDETTSIAAVMGMRGMGKTELAIQYAIQCLENYTGGICWIFAGEFAVGPQIVRFAESQLDLTIPSKLELIDQVNFCWTHWLSGNVLLVLDDVVDFEHIRDYLPTGRSRFKTLITTQLTLGVPVKPFSLSVLSREASIELLIFDQFVGEARVSQEREIAHSLCDWLGYLPLGLELVGRYLRQELDTSIAEMLFRLQSVALKEESLIRDPNDPTWSLTAQRGVAAAFELSWERLNLETHHLGYLLGMFALAPFSWDWVESAESHYCTLSEGEMNFDRVSLRRSRRELMRFHLLQRVEQHTYLLHSLVRKFFQQKMEE